MKGDLLAFFLCVCAFFLNLPLGVRSLKPVIG